MTFHFLCHNANAIARKSCIKGGSVDLVPRITIFTANAINPSNPDTSYVYSLKSTYPLDSEIALSIVIAVHSIFSNGVVSSDCRTL